jgi:UDP-3-O-[3-hydroxymyristoyl] glucosamine N-acyltransferase
MARMLSAQTIKDDHADIFTFLQGDLASCADQCQSPKDACRNSLVYINEATQLDEAHSHKPSILIIDAKIAHCVGDLVEPIGCFFSVRAIPMAMAVLLRYFDHKAERFEQWGERHATALVHPTATIGEDVILGPYCVIGARSTIGDGCRIGSHCVVENDVTIGANTTLHPQVFVGASCVIGSCCEIHPHTSIGSDGFGYAMGRDGRSVKIPHLGNVVIGDDVEIGSNCAIDRAKLSSTFIRSGAKLDNICHIAHNCDLGENGLYTAGFMMGGSTRIGRQFVTGGNSVVTSHVTIADNVVLQGRSNVTNNIPKAGAYGGYPLQPLKEALKTAVSVGQLNELRKRVNRMARAARPSERAAGDAAAETEPQSAPGRNGKDDAV